MLSKILTAVLVISVLGCKGKAYKKDENSNVEIVEELNRGNSSSVIEKLSTKASPSPREIYYLASAYSAAGGVDVLSLYSVLELQLFRKNALEWTDLSKEKNPYLRFMRQQEGVDEELRKKKRAERWAAYEEKIIEQRGFKLTKPTIEKLKETNTFHDYTTEEYETVDSKFREIVEKLLKESLSTDDRLTRWYDESGAYVQEQGIWIYYQLYNYYGDLLHFESLKDNYLNPDKVKGAFGGIPWEMVYMNILWNTYEAIPIIRQLPSLAETHQDNITQALETYAKLLQSPEYRNVALKNMAILVSVSLLSIYKQSFDFEEVHNPQDLICSFTPDAVISNYPLVRTRVLFLADVLENENEDKELKAYKEQLDAFRESLPETLSEDQKSNYLNGVEEFRVKSCFSN